MNLPPYRTFLLQAAMMTWMLIGVGLFFMGPGRQSGIHLFYFENWQQLSTQMTGIALLTFWGNLFWSLIKITLFSLSIWGAGMSLLAGLSKDAYLTTNQVAMTPTAFVLGQGLFSIVLLLPVVIAQRLPLFYSLAVFFVGLFLALGRMYSVRDQLVESIRNTLQSFQGLERLLIVSSLLVMVAALGYSSSLLSYDAASQYFAQAKMLAVTQQFISLSFKDVFLGSALYLVSIYAALIQLFGDQTARLYSWISGLVILALSWKLGRQIGLTRRATLLSLSLILTSTAFVDMLGDGKIDLANYSITLAAIYWFIESLQHTKNESFLLAGFFTGYSLLSRPYNVVPLGIFFASLLGLHLFAERERLLVALRNTRRGLLWFMIPLFFWLLLNLAVNQVILQDALAPIRVFEQTDDDWPFHIAPGKKWLLTTLYPFIITFTGLRDTPGFISPFFIAFLPLLLDKPPDRLQSFAPDLIRITLSALVALYFWIVFFGNRHILDVRYVFFTWVLLFFFGAFIADRVMYRSRFYYYGIAFVTISALVIMALRVLLISLATYSPEANGHFRCQHLRMCAFIEMVNRLASPGERVLVLSGYRYYLRPDLFVCASVGEEYSLLQSLTLRSQDEFWKEIYQHGYRYIVYDRFFVKYILRLKGLPPLENPPPWLNLSVYDFSFIYDDNREVILKVYRIEGAHGPPDLPVQKACVSSR